MKKLKTKYMAMAVMILGIATVSFFACRFTIGKRIIIHMVWTFLTIIT